MNTIPSQRKTAVVATVTLFLGSLLGSSAVITWGGATNVSATSDVLNTGSTIEAFNLGYAPTGLNSVTVNGVLFTASLQPSPLTETSGGAFSQLNGSTSGDASYDSLLNSVAFGGGPSTSLTMGGGALVSGQPYQVQIWFVEERTASNLDERVMTYGDGNGNTVDLGNTTGNQLGQYATGTFTADGPDQTLTLVANGFGNSHLTAYQVRQIPEPSAAVLAGLAGMMLLRRRRS